MNGIEFGEYVSTSDGRMADAINEDIAGLFDEAALILTEQGANRFRIQAYRKAATVLRSLSKPVSDIFATEGFDGLKRIPGIGASLALSIKSILLHGRFAMLDRLRGQHDPIALLSSVPGIGRTLASKLHSELDIDTLEQLEAAAHDGRLETIAGLGLKRLAGIRDTLAHRLGRVRQSPTYSERESLPPVAEVLDVDREYRREAEAGTLKRIAPRRFNPNGEAWLPILHTVRGERHYTALFSNTARAHQLHRCGNWVVLYFDGHDGEDQCTVITSEFGRLKGKRIVRGREPECEDHYGEQAKSDRVK